MKIMSAIALLWGTCAFAGINPTDDIYADSLSIQSVTEIPGSLDASGGRSGAALASNTDLDDTAIESVSDLVEASKPAPKKSARK